MNTFRRLRNVWIPGVATIVLGSFSSAFAQQSYKITDLGVSSSKDNFSMAMGLNSQGWTENMDGFVNPPENSTSTSVASGRAVISIYGFNIDLGTLGKPDGNSWINWGGINDRGEAAGMSETADLDPNGEDICGFGTHLTCVPFLWRQSHMEGHMNALPTLGGNNGQASAINNRGEVVGFAEDGSIDSTCSIGTMNNRIILPALWKKGNVGALPLVSDDPDGVAYGINEKGHAVGYTGNCNAQTHAVIWKDNTAYVLPDLGGTVANSAYAISNRGQIVGQVSSADNTTGYAAVWQNGADGVVTQLRLLPGDVAAFATGINNRGQVVGSDFDSHGNWAHGFIWQDGVLTDLNNLIPADSNLFIISASNINERGQISGMATVLSGPHAGQIRAFLATPSHEKCNVSIADVARTSPKMTLPANIGKQLLPKLGLNQFQR